MTTAMHASKASDSTATLRHTAAGISLLIAVLYGLIWSGVVDVVRDAEPGELGILGVAGVVFVALAALLWWSTSRLLWLGTATLQVLMIWMYIAIGAERDPAFEVWGISIRVAQVVLIGVLIALLVRSVRARRHGS